MWLDPWMLALLLKVAKLLGLPILGGGGWLTRRWLLSRSTHWPMVQGRVQGLGPGGDKAMCLLSYSYVVNGEYYSGEIPIFKSRVFRKTDDVRLALPSGSAIDVRYSPTNPEHSVGLIPEMVLNGGFPVQV